MILETFETMLETFSPSFLNLFTFLKNIVSLGSIFMEKHGTFYALFYITAACQPPKRVYKKKEQAYKNLGNYHDVQEWKNRKLALSMEH
ncbi:MAG: hypothetical protein GY820_04275 [Gammaproteobacteria bacterium]|nr:hypothetical protein [Gammaproteobacteria bacterium]